MNSNLLRFLFGMTFLFICCISSLSAQPTYRYRFDSVPFGAEIIATTEQGNVILGTTPLVYESEKPLLNSVQIQKKGYKTQVVLIDPTKFTQPFAILESEKMTTRLPFKMWLKPSKKTVWIDVLASSMIVAGSVFSIRNKFEANALFDQYSETGDPTLRPIIKKYDTKAGWGLATMQTGIGVVVLRLVLK